MIDEERDRVTAALSKCRPAPSRVIVYQGAALTHEIPVPSQRKRWAAVLDIVGRLPWTALHLLDAKGGLLAIVEPASGPLEPAGALELQEGAPELGLSGGQLLGLMLRAQEVALSYRSKEADAALQACVQVMRETTGAITALATTFRHQLQAIKDVQDSGTAGASSPEEESQSMKLLAQIAPALLQKLLAAPSAPAPPPTPNGVKP